MSSTTAIQAQDSTLREHALQLARRYGLSQQDDPDAVYRLVLTPQHLELQTRQDVKCGPIYVDWAAGRAAHRRRYGGGRGQPLAKAVGLKAGATPRVIDATAGLGRDAFVLACMGCTVTLVERDPVVAALLADGYARAVADPEIGAMVAAHMRVEHADAVTFLQSHTGDAKADVVYLDPMYPGREKNSLVKKEMRALQGLLGKDPAATALLPAALAAAAKRVVVKRPMTAPTLDERSPTMTIKGKKHRYDVYVIEALHP